MSEPVPQRVPSIADQPSSETPPSRKKVAVIAVHGVGRHAAGQTQNNMADLLLSLPAQGYAAQRTYAPFRSVNLRLALQPLRLGKPVVQPRVQTTAKKIVSLFQERSAAFADCLKDTSEMPLGKVATEYTDLLLEHYEGGADSNFYETNRLEGGRADGTCDVHVYEVLWSDLTKPNSGVLTFFVRLFQLLLQLAGVSRLALDSGSAEATGRVWTAQRWSQRWAVRMLQIFIPLAEILLFIALTSCLPGMIDATKGNAILPVLLGGLGMHAVFFWQVWTSQWRFRLGWFWWVVLALMPGTLGSLLVLVLLHMHVPVDAVTAVLWWLVPGAGLLYWILTNYKNVRRGVEPTGWIMFAACLIGYVVSLGRAFRSHSPDAVPQAAFWIAEILLASIRGFWALLIVFAAAAAVLGFVGCMRFPKGSPERARARAAVRTGRLALALPAVTFMLVTMLLWNGFIHLTESQFKQPILKAQLAPLSRASFLERFSLLPTQEQTAASVAPATAPCASVPTECSCCSQPAAPAANATTATPPRYNDASAILAWSVGYHLPVTLALIGLAAFLTVWWALPSVLTERFPYRQKSGAPRSTTDAVSVHMGTWLSRGLDATRVVTLLFWSAIFLVPAAYLLLNTFHLGHLLPGLIDRPLQFALDWLQASTRVLVISYAALATVILAALAKGGQTVLGIVLDVDTYLSGLPDEATPRAKIFERYASTLRYVNAQGYDSVVIAAHSLGALISGDILHYIHAKNPDNVTSEAVDSLHPSTRLFTFGNPTRQLLNRFFPYLYDWVRARPDNAVEPLPGPAGLPGPVTISQGERPYPHELGVTHWASGYRSGDYVGRSLWLSEWFFRGANAVPDIIRSDSNDRAECCIGAGAHTHYMDDTAPDMAILLDRLITDGHI